MNNERINDELAEMRQQMDSLKSMLRHQQIVSEQMIRRALAGDYGQTRRTVWGAALAAVVSTPIYLLLLPRMGFPLWYAVLSALLLVVALAVSIYSVRRYVPDDLATCNLTEVAERLVRYKRLCNNWLKYFMPVLALWLVGFFYISAGLMDSQSSRGMAYGGAVGGVIGTVAGLVYYRQSQRRLDRMVAQIEEFKGTADAAEEAAN